LQDEPEVPPDHVGEAYQGLLFTQPRKHLKGFLAFAEAFRHVGESMLLPVDVRTGNRNHIIDPQTSWKITGIDLPEVDPPIPPLEDGELALLNYEDDPA